MRCENHAAHGVQVEETLTAKKKQTSGDIRKQLLAPAVYKRHNVQAAVVV